MRFIESVVVRSRHIEKLLADLGGQGKGIHERVTSISSLLPTDLFKRIRFIASVRNKVMHDHDYHFDANEREFLDTCDAVVCELQEILDPKGRRVKSFLWPVITAVLATIQSYVACRSKLPIAYTSTKTVVVTRGFFFDDKKQVEVIDWEGVNFATLFFCVATFAVVFIFFFWLLNRVRATGAKGA
jgi:hypothetical protein